MAPGVIKGLATTQQEIKRVCYQIKERISYKLRGVWLGGTKEYFQFILRDFESKDSCLLVTLWS